MPFVSVIMACHNAQNFLDESISSVLNQSFTDWELIIIDDKSTDNSLMIAQSYQNIDKRIHVFSSNINLGPGSARNFAIEKANGTWLAILDADDVFLYNKLFEQVKIIKNIPNLVLIGSGMTNIDELGNKLSSYSYPVNTVLLKKNLLNFKAFPPHSSLMYKSESVKRIGAFNNIFSPSEDFDLWLRLINTGDFYCVNRELIHYRVHSSNISKNINNEGLTQIDFGYAAKICFLLRERGLKDPSTEFDKHKWLKFMNNISNIIKNSGELEYRNNKNRLRNILKNKNIFMIHNLLKLSSIIKLSIKILYYKLTKRSIPERCLDYFIKNPII
jgi:glycosyltransferase involved in cell wall biosynthesis